MAKRYVDANILDDLANNTSSSRGDLQEVLSMSGWRVNEAPGRGWDHGAWADVRSTIRTEIRLLDDDTRSLRDRSRRTRTAASERALWEWVMSWERGAWASLNGALGFGQHQVADDARTLREQAKRAAAAERKFWEWLGSSVPKWLLPGIVPGILFPGMVPPIWPRPHVPPKRPTPAPQKPWHRPGDSPPIAPAPPSVGASPNASAVEALAQLKRTYGEGSSPEYPVGWYKGQCVSLVKQFAARIGGGAKIDTIVGSSPTQEWGQSALPSNRR